MVDNIIPRKYCFCPRDFIGECCLDFLICCRAILNTSNIVMDIDAGFSPN